MNPEDQQPPPLPAEPPILNYGHAGRIKTEAARWGPFLGGFFLSLAACTAGFFIFAFTGGNRGGEGSILFVFIVAMIIASVIVLAAKKRRDPKWRGFGRGVIIGMVLGMLALGPCAFCYIAGIK